MVAYQVESGELIRQAEEGDRFVFEALLQLRCGKASAQRDHVAISCRFGQVAHGAGLKNPPVVHNGEAVAELLGFFEVVRGEKDRCSLAGNVADNIKNRIPGLRIDADGWFVQKKNFRTVHQSRGQIQTPLHPPGISRDRFPRTVGQAHPLKDFLNALFQLRPRDIIQPAPEKQVLTGCELLVKRHFLWNQT